MKPAKLTLFSHRLKRRFFSNVIVARIILAFIFLVAIVIGYLFLSHRINNLFPNFSLISGKDLPQVNGRTNFLILGSGGLGHEGADLSDTLVFVSADTKAEKIILISVPRDLWVSSLQAKINSAYHYGFQKESTPGGLLLAKSSVSELVGQPVHFVVNLDFSTFTRAVDILGGLDIVVDKAFIDDLYPVPGKENDLCGGDPQTACRYEQVRFESGAQHMDGQTALKYVRSRHSSDPQEGTDFARSKRQSKVISAIKSKLTSVSTLKHLEIYSQLYRLVSASVISDITPQYYSSLFWLGLKLRHFQTYSYTLSVPDQLENPPVSPEYGDQWVLIPKGKDPSVIHNYVKSLLNSPK